MLIYKLNFYTDTHKEHNLEYDSIKKYMTSNSIDPKKISTLDVSRMISDIRSLTLPDPIEVPNAGSFFKNNVINKSDIKLDKFSIDELVLWEIDSEKVKVGSARLIELIKNELTKFDNVGIYENHSLVLITNKNANQKNVIDFAEHIKERIYDTFHITLEIEPTVISN